MRNRSARSSLPLRRADSARRAGCWLSDPGAADTRPTAGPRPDLPAAAARRTGPASRRRAGRGPRPRSALGWPHGRRSVHSRWSCLSCPEAPAAGEAFCRPAAASAASKSARPDLPRGPSDQCRSSPERAPPGCSRPAHGFARPPVRSRRNSINWIFI